MRKVFYMAVLALLAVACAKQGYPSGGPKDTEPPQAVSCTPQNESRNFGKNQFAVHFNEYVVLKDAENNVLISPPMKQKPEFTAQGKKVVVKIKDTLQANTTYLFQFKGAVIDYTEGNALPSFEYVFSTGDVMDTLMLAGHVTQARNGALWKETLTVAAYRGADTMPSFVTRTDPTGGFAFHYIPSGDYRIVAFEDRDRDLQVGASEPVAWDEVRHAATDSVDSAGIVCLRISAPERKAQRLLKSEFTEKGRIILVAALPMQHPVLSGEAVEWRLNERRDTMTVWCLNAKCDSTVLMLSDEGMSDTLKLRYRQTKSRPRRARGVQAPQPGDSPQPLMRELCGGSDAFYDDLRLAFSVPIVKVADSAMAEVMWMKDSSVSRYPLLLDSTGLTARIDATLRSGESYHVRLRDSLFTNLYGTPTDSLSFTLTPRDYATLTLHVDNQTGSPLVVEVLDNRDTVVQQMTLPSQGGTLRFSHLKAAEYRLRAVLDVDANGSWTTGDYRLRRQPEECLLYEKKLQLREKWELEERWTVTTQTQ